MHQQIRGRYAPSPTGRLHLGNARTALLSWLDIRIRGGTYVMRIEDVDSQRSRPEYEAGLLRDLAWIGIDWDEGPDVGGPYGPYRQSACSERYAAVLASLATFDCTCTRRELAQAPRSTTGEVIYPGYCIDGSQKPGKPAAIRWKCPPGQVGFSDRFAGTVIEEVARETGDFIVRRRDGDWAYQLAVVVDDAAMAMTDVMRGVDLLLSTPRQIHLGRALGYPELRYAHVPLILGPDGSKLSKRHNAPDLQALREGGVAPEAVIGKLARSVGLIPKGVEQISTMDLLARCRETHAARGIEALDQYPLDLDCW